MLSTRPLEATSAFLKPILLGNALRLENGDVLAKLAWLCSSNESSGRYWIEARESANFDDYLLHRTDLWSSVQEVWKGLSTAPCQHLPEQSSLPAHAGSLAHRTHDIQKHPKTITGHWGSLSLVLNRIKMDAGKMSNYT